MEDFSNRKSKKLQNHIHKYTSEPTPSEIRRDFLVNQLLTTAEQFCEREKFIQAIKQTESRNTSSSSDASSIRSRSANVQKRACRQVSEIYKKIRSIDKQSSGEHTYKFYKSINAYALTEPDQFVKKLNKRINQIHELKYEIENEQYVLLNGTKFETDFGKSLKDGKSLYSVFKTKSTLSSKFTGCPKCLQKMKYKMKNEKFIFLDHGKCCDYSDDKTLNELFKTKKPIYDSFYENSKELDELNEGINLDETFNDNDNLESKSLIKSLSSLQLKRSKKLNILCTKTNRASPEFTDSFDGNSSVGELKLDNNDMWDNLIQKIKYVEGAPKRAKKRKQLGLPSHKSDSMSYCFRQIMTTGFITMPERIFK